jgi:predicted GIY-YIG superfamily endonuclease
MTNAPRESGRERFASWYRRVLPEVQTTYVVYTFWNENGTPLYVGVTGNLRSRLREHYKKSWVRAEVERCTVSQPMEKPLASREERAQIIRLRPKYNKNTPVDYTQSLREKYLAGESPSSIARSHDISRQRVYQLLKASGVKMKQERQRENYEELLKPYLAGDSPDS